MRTIAIVVALVLGGVLAIRNFPPRRPRSLGVHAGRLADCPISPNCVSSQAGDAPHRVEPIPLDGDPREAVRRLKAAIGSIPRMRVVTEEAGYLHAEATSLVFRFVDDVEFLVDPQAGVIHVRSASRRGHSDLGVNRRRVERIRSTFLAMHSSDRGRE